MEGRRYSEGLHQAIEAKKGVLVREENQTLAPITLQNYFRLYDKLSGMTGTALTEDAEFREITSCPFGSSPPNKPVPASLTTTPGVPYHRGQSSTPSPTRSSSAMRQASPSGGHRLHRELRAAIRLLTSAASRTRS